MLKVVATSMPNNIWQKLENTPEGEADPMSTVGEDMALHVVENSLDFKDVLDVINPLQHIPVVSTIYRTVSGDTINDIPKFIGSALFNGPVGLIAALGATIIKAETNLEKSSSNNKGSSNQKIEEKISLNVKGKPKQELETKEPKNQLYSPVSSQKLKTFQLNSNQNSLINIPHSVFSKTTYPTHSRQSDNVQTVNGSALDRLIQNSAPVRVDQNTNQNSHKPENRVIVDRQNVERWMLEKLMKYEKLGHLN